MPRRVRAFALILLVLAMIVLPSCHKHSVRASVAPSEVSRSFAPGGTVRIDLSRGNVEVIGRAGGTVVARCVESCEAALHLSPDGDARIWTDTPAGSTFGSGPKYVIEVPEVSDVSIHLAAGNLDLNGVKGSKDIVLNAGNATLAIGRADDYGRVSLKVTAGTLSAGPWSAYAAGLVQNVSRSGEGQYSLRAVVNAGNLTIKGEKATGDDKQEGLL
ncbi:MAG TPA: hypothetical protein VD837_04670 [Terriglobales bacterium]|nr:hypothetical protein [Terriglobales bacterium]